MSKKQKKQRWMFSSLFSRKTANDHRGLNVFSRVGIAEDQEYLLENLSMLVESGMDIPETLQSIATEMRTPQMRRMMKQAKEDIENGFPVWKALEETNILPAHIIALLHIGEESGRLPKNLKMVALQQQKQRLLVSKVRSSLAYPLIVLSLSLFIGIGISWFILPRLSVVFAQLKIDLPFVTGLFIQFGVFLGKYGSIVVPLFLLFFFSSLYFVFFHQSTKYIGQWILLRTPIIHQLIKQAELSRLGYMMGALLEAGIPVTEALLSLEKASTFRQYQKLYRILRENMEEGISFGETFERYKETRKLIPAPVQQLIASGERSGNLSHIFLKIGESYEGKTEYTTKNLAALLEPILLVIIWGGVVSVALAVVLPIYTLVGNMRTGINKPPKPKTAIVVEVSSPTNGGGGVSEDVRKALENTVQNDQEKNETKPLPENLIQNEWGKLPTETKYHETSPSETAPIVEKTVDVPQEKSKKIEVIPNVPLLNVRSGPSVSFPVETQIAPGNTYVVLEESEKWRKIALPEGKEGWVSGAYTQEISEER